MKLHHLLLAILFSSCLQAQEVALRIEAVQATADRIKIEGARSASITEGGAAQLRLIPNTEINPKASQLEFEAFSLGGCQNVTATLQLPSGLTKKLTLPAIDHSETWSRYSATLFESGESAPHWKSLILDLTLTPEATLSIRNARVTPLSNEKAASHADPGPVAERSELIQKYLETKTDARIDRIVMTESEVTVTFTTGSDSNSLFLGEMPIHRSIDEPQRFELMTPIKVGPNSTSSLILPRVRERLGKQFDSLTSRWQLVKVVDGERLPVSHARYADEIPSAHPNLPAGEAKTKKGLGGWSASRPPHGDLEKLGISAVTVNILVDSLLSPKPAKHTTPFSWQGRTYHANNNVLSNFDKSLIEAARHEALVSAILLVANPNKNGTNRAKTVRSKDSQILGHPDADPSAAYAMPAMDSDASVGAYGAAIHLLATRYSRPDGKFGRIHHYIVHNEVDAGWTWTNCGVKPLPYFFDLYHRSMRLVDLITRSQDPNARPFITLTHHWAEPGNPKFYGSKFMLLELAKWTRTEGDFPWALAHHPYPASLRKPRTWEDNVSFSFDSDRITPKNIEVLDAWMKRPDMLDQHGKLRPIHLSENGFNSPDYSQKSLTDQAAGMAYAWKRIEALDSIGVWHYHNWIDNRHEGGLRIGLRKFPDDEHDPLGEKPIFELYRQLATPNEEKACAPYLPIIGIQSWTEAAHPPERIRSN